MRIAVRHGINGDEELTTQVVTGVTGGWDLMQQMASRLALDSPFQIVLYLNSTAEILSPVRTVSSQMASLDSEICYLVQKLQYPTAEHYQTIMTAVYEKDVIELLYLLGQGIDLTWNGPDGGDTSSLLTMAIFRDNDSDTYKFQASKDLHFPRPGVSLTYLLLQSLANPNILPPKQQPTTMLELAVELGNSHLVQLLLEERAMVHPEGDAVPPLMTAVLHRHRKNVQLLLEARADPWRTTPIVSLCDHPWYWFGFLSRHESVNAVQIAFVQGPEDTVADLLPNMASIQQSVGETQHPNYDDTAMTDHAKILLGNLVQKYYSSRPHITRGCYTTHRWRRVLEGLYLPVRIREELRRPGELTHPGTLLDQLD